MLKVICGENEVASRERFAALKKELKEKGYLIIELDPANFFEKIESFKETPGLFSPKVAFFAENTVKKFSRRTQFKKVLLEFAEDKDKTLIIWEALTARELTVVDKKYIEEFKFPENVFQLLDAFYPGNFKKFHNLLFKVEGRMPEYLLFYLLVKRVHQLAVLNFSGDLKLPSWQLKKLKFQASKWEKNKLLKAIEGLYKIDVRLKTSSTPFSFVDSLDILASLVL